MVEILYYSDNKLDKTLLGIFVKKCILQAGLPIISVTLKPINFGRNIHYKGRRGQRTMIKQIRRGLKNSEANHIFICEHDVLYHRSHFKFKPPKDNVYYYNNNVIKYKPSINKAISYDCKWFSQCVANRKLLLQHFNKKLELIEQGKRAWGFEPGTGQSKKIDRYKTESFESEIPNIDIRHGKNFTGSGRMRQEEFRNKNTCQNWKEYNVKDIPYWKLGGENEFEYKDT